MTRCSNLDAWLDEQEKKLDKADKETKKECDTVKDVKHRKRQKK